MKEKIGLFFGIIAAVLALIGFFFATFFMVAGEIVWSMWETVRHGNSSYTTRKVSAFKTDPYHTNINMCGR